MTRRAASPELSPSRISRLLRPLRTKCIALAMHHTPQAAATYGSRTSSEELPPLEALPPPGSIRSYHVDHASLRTVLYAVRDCFREIVTKSKSLEESVPAPRIPRLADLCSTIVGEHIEGEDSELPNEEGPELLAEMESVYEIIPVRYRRSALLAHSLDIVLRFSHHFTLLSILLDICLQHNLSRESCVLLRWLFHAAVSPTAEACSTPRLANPAHSNYLVDLWSRWREANMSSTAFIQLLSSASLESARPELVWGCKAFTRFTRELCTRDSQLLIYMACHLVASFSDAQAERASTHPIPKHRRSGATQWPLTDHLNTWLNYSSSFPSQESAFALLEQCFQCAMHRRPSDTLVPTLVCWATHYLSAVPATTTDNNSIPLRLLRDVSPTPTMYRLLVEKTFKQTRSTFEPWESMRLLKVYAGFLKAHDLSLLEASLWASALQFVETSLDFLGSQARAMQEELMVLVDDAERRCFQSGCEWEESMRCWIQRDLPATKKAKHGHNLERESFGAHRRQAIRRGRSSCPLADISNEALGEEEEYGDETSTFEQSFTCLISATLSSRTRLHVPSGQDRTMLKTRICAPECVATSDDALDLFAYS